MFNKNFFSIYKYVYLLKILQIFSTVMLGIKHHFQRKLCALTNINNAVAYDLSAKVNEKEVYWYRLYFNMYNYFIFSTYCN